ncbi:MAG: S-layer homology domain-containing protein, partial [Oscillospiraceae bacterium]
EISKIREEIEFEDGNSISDYATENIKILYSAGIISGDNDGNFRPLDILSRAESAKILYEVTKL